MSAAKGRLILMGSPEFALPTFKRLLDDGHDVLSVLSQPDRPAGRGRKSRPTAVAAWAREAGLPVITPEKLRDAGLREELAALDADLFVVVAYRILPPRMIALPRLGAVNLHGSLLPAYRGAAPIQRALMDGVSQTGLTTFLIEKGVDTGRILLQETMQVGQDENLGQLHDRMMTVGAELMSKTVRGLLDGKLVSREQDDARSSPAPKLSIQDRALDPARDATSLHNTVRGLSPFPAALIELRGQPCKLLATRVIDEDSPGEPGRLIRDGKRLLMECGQGLLELLEWAPSGRRAMAVRDWLNGTEVEAGERLCLPKLGDVE